MGKPSNVKDQGMAKKKNKQEKKSKPTLTKGEREREKLEKAGEEFRRNSREYGLFLDRMDKWLKTHHQQAMQLFCKYDKIENGILQYEEFKLGMRDLNIPCVEAQLHILARLLDPNNTGTIDYVELGAGIDKTRYRQSSIEEEEEEEDEAKEAETDDERTAVRGGKEERGISKEAGTTLVITKEELNRCPSCHLGLWNPVGVSEARYISLELRIISFNDMKCHPGHFQHTVYSHMKVYGLIGQIRGWTGVESTVLNIYRDHSCSRESLLPLELSLEECGFPGGPHHSPTTALLYYDYCIEFSNCPILNCDHYINFRRL
ncbi:uncharacterized protein LOC127580103 [Pristis pectinata]|uniref:uncharacterized protein LOC127580103 n=1 Tax=Pristis pectinata TaxID=685728 RepID=UPI00223E6D9B|nr:uncharacterized protein LOC127580103 [Pristis pectinata]